MTTQHEYSKWCNWWRKLAVFACCLCFSTTMATATVAALATANLASGASAAAAAATAPVAVSTVPAGAGTAVAAAPVAAASTATTGAAYRKRVVLRSIDPLTRRSAVDKHFIRFGRNEQHLGADKSINLRKREILQDGYGYGDDGDGDGYATANAGSAGTRAGGGDVRGRDPTISGLTSSLQSLPQSSLLACSSSSANSSNHACFGRLRFHHFRPHLQKQQQQQQQQQQQRHRLRYDVSISNSNSNDANPDSSDLLADTDTNDDSTDNIAVEDRSDDNANNNDDHDDDDDDDDNDNYSAPAPASTFVEEIGDDGDDNDEYAASGEQRTRLRPRTPSKAGSAIFVRPGYATAATSALSSGADRFVRTSRNTFGRNLFSRYDRGRDNFMRLGRSKATTSESEADADVTKEKTAPLVDETDGGGGGYDDDDDDNDDGEYVVGRGRDVRASWSRTKRGVSAAAAAAPRFLRQHSFMRLGRKYDSNFMRLGRMNTRSSSFIRYGRNGPTGSGSGSGSGSSAGGDYDRWTRKHDNFIRLGRNEQRSQRRQTKREKPQNFLRLGRPDPEYDDVFGSSSSSSLSSSSSSPPPRLVRKSNNFMRLGRPDPNYDNIFTPPRHVRKSDNFVRFGRGVSAAFDRQSGWNFGRRDDEIPAAVMTLRRFTSSRRHYPRNRDRYGGGDGGGRRRRQADAEMSNDSRLRIGNGNGNNSRDPTPQLDYRRGHLQTQPRDDHQIFALPNMVPIAPRVSALASLATPLPSPAAVAFSSNQLASHLDSILPQKQPSPSPSSSSSLRQLRQSSLSAYSSVAANT